jgi:hypothetical protein
MDGESCTPIREDLSDLTPEHLSSAQQRDVMRGYVAPEVRGLRGALDAYLAHDAPEYARQLLQPVATSTLRSRFLLLADGPDDYGGSLLVIQFRGHTEAVYTAWVYPIGGATYELRGWVTNRCSLTQQRWMKAHYGSSVDGA